MQLQMAAAMFAALVMAAGTMAKCRDSVKPAGKSMANMMLKRCRGSLNFASLAALKGPLSRRMSNFTWATAMDGALDLLHPQHDARGAGAVARAAGSGNHGAQELQAAIAVTPFVLWSGGRLLVTR